MKSSKLKVRITSIFLFLTTFLAIAQESKIEDFNAFSVQFLETVKAGKDSKAFQDKLANTTIEALEKGLQTDEQKLAFWVNVYNAYIQVILSKNPELYEDRQAFFNDDRVLIAGEMRAFAKIEHGIIRKSQWPLGLGRIRKWFPNKFERKLRVSKRDHRVHFALNCGAKDCPPVAIYDDERLEEQFSKGQKQYLNKTTVYNEENKTVAVTSLFSWFRGDFGGKKGTKKILIKEGLIPNKDVDLEFKSYDWTLDLDNWTEL